MSRNTLIDLYVARQNSINPDSSSHVNAFGLSLTYLLDK
jgi:hypothetical protein